MRSDESGKRHVVEVVRGDSQALLVLGWYFVSPSTHANARGAQRIQGPEVVVGFDQPVVLKCIRQQEHGACSSRRHGGVEEAWARAFGRSSRHVRWTFLVGAQLDQRLAFHPQVAVSLG